MSRGPNRRASSSPILIGVVHRDPEGHEPLLSCLKTLGPDVLCVETSPFGLTWRERRGGELRKRLDNLLDHIPVGKREHHQVQLIREALALPFEYTASLAFATLYQIGVHCIDLNWISRRHLYLFESEIIDKENLIALSQTDDTPLHIVIQRVYQSAAWRLNDFHLISDWDHALDRRRERFMACRLRGFCEKFARVVYVGGWRHLAKDREGRSLANLLGDLSPRRILLRYGELATMTR